MDKVNLTKVTVNLSKGGKVNLTKQAEGLKQIMIGLGWDPVGESTGTPKILSLIRSFFGDKEDDYDLDAFVVMLRDGKYKGDTPEDKHRGEEDVIYFNNLCYRYKGEVAIRHMGDNLTGKGKAGSDKEQILINLDKIPKDVDELVICVALYEGKQRNQSLANVKNSFIRVVDTKDNFEICKFGSTQMSSNSRAEGFIAGKLYRDHKDWAFEAIGETTEKQWIGDIAKLFM